MWRRSSRYFRVNWGAPFIVAFTVILVASVLLLSKGNSASANYMANYAFVFLALGVILEIASHVRHAGVESKSAVNPTPMVAATVTPPRTKMKIRVKTTKKTLLVIIIFLFVVTLAALLIYSEGDSAFQFSSEPLTQGLVGYWPLAEGKGISAYDLSGNNNTGTLNSPSWFFGSSCKFANCINFSSSSGQVVNVANSPNLNPSYITVSLWVSMSMLPSSNAFLVVSDLGSTHQFGIYVNSVGQFLTYAYDNSGTTFGPVYSPLKYSTSTWYFLTMTYSSSELILYVNGEKVASIATNGNPLHSGTTLSFGADTDFQYFSGTIAQVSIYNKALSSSQVSEIYSSGIPTKQS